MKTTTAKKKPFGPASYPQYEGERGNADSWADSFRARMGGEAAKKVLQKDSPFAVLGVSMSATWPEIRKAYRALALQHHPDHGGTDAMFIKIQAAYEVLEERLAP